MPTLWLQVSEAELEAIARGGADGLDPEMAEGAGGDTTRRLLGDYATPARCFSLLPYVPVWKVARKLVALGHVASMPVAQ